MSNLVTGGFGITSSQLIPTLGYGGGFDSAGIGKGRPLTVKSTWNINVYSPVLKEESFERILLVDLLKRVNHDILLKVSLSKTNEELYELVGKLDYGELLKKLNAM